MSSLKEERMVHDSGHDRLSELPSSIIDIIVSSISTRDAVHMSILSRQFRYIWLSQPHLAFHSSEFSSKHYMKNFITNALKLHKEPIFKFELSAHLELSLSTVNEWLLSLPKNEIRELILNFDPDCDTDGKEWVQLHSTVCSCNELTHLELSNCKMGRRPLTFTGFSFLRSLILVDVYISQNDIESIVIRSPLLETLKLDSCCLYDGNIVLRIWAPDLKHLYLVTRTSDCMEIYLYAPCLVEMFVSMKDEESAIFDYLEQDKSWICNYTNLLSHCSSLEKLKGDLYFTKVLSFGIESVRCSFVSYHLRVIELSNVNFGDVKEALVVARLAIGAPNLQMFTLMCNNILGFEGKGEVEDPSVSYLDFVRPSGFKWKKLTVINMCGLTGLPYEIEFLNLLLENSPVLERMNVQRSAKRLKAELLKCKTAAPNFKLVW